ncbi:MAG: PIN domain-containing protein [Thermoprotei archaeon]|nr:PIN domain-containing protein [Thermoprotei archaeon]
MTHYLVVYEPTYHWRKGRLPFRNEEELLDFVSTYFNIANLTPKIAVAAALIKIEGDKALRSSEETRLRRRKLSTSDAITIALAQKLKKPIITGDKDLTYVAEKIGIRTIW